MKPRLPAFVAAGIAALMLAGCEPRYKEVVVDSCVRDGQPLKYCTCIASQMKQALGYRDYAVFSDLVLLSGAEEPTPEELLTVMSEQGLTPYELTRIRERITSVGEAAQELCARS